MKSSFLSWPLPCTGLWAVSSCTNCLTAKGKHGKVEKEGCNIAWAEPGCKGGEDKRLVGLEWRKVKNMFSILPTLSYP